jgi:transketolase
MRLLPMVLALDAPAVDRFGASAPGPVVMEHYGFTVANVCRHARRLAGRETRGE